MCYRQWEKTMEVGIIELDIQHRNLLYIIGLLEDVLKEGNYTKQAKRILREFDNFIRYHFKTEEDMFIKYGYSDQEHIDTHNEILAKLDKLDKSNCDKKCLNALLKLGKFLFDEHTVKMDQKFADYLKSLES